MNNRRKLLVAIGSSFVAWPLVSSAQLKVRPARIALLRQASLNSSKIYLGAFQDGLRELGYVEGTNLVLEMRFADGMAERLPAFAAELAKLKVDVIVATDTPSTQAAQRATSTIPIVMVNILDPLASGFVTNLARPGGNITGFSITASEVASKQIELMGTMVPKLSRIAVLMNPANSGHRSFLLNIQGAANRKNITILPVEAATPLKIESAFAIMAQELVGAVIVASDSLFLQERSQIAILAIKHRIPSMSGFRPYAEAGLLMSYGQDPTDFWRRSAGYVDKILKGTKPGDLPVQQATDFQLLINRTTATTLGLNVPSELELQAEKVIY